MTGVIFVVCFFISSLHNNLYFKEITVAKILRSNNLFGELEVEKMEKSENYPLTIQNSSRYPSFIFGIKTITTKKLPKRDGLHHFLAKRDEKQQSILSLLSLFNKKYFF